MKEISVFFDLEGMGVPHTIENDTRIIELLGAELAPALLKKGYTIVLVIGFASIKRKEGIVSWARRRNLNTLFQKFGWQLRWTSDIADKDLIAELKRRKADGSLTDCILLVANDHDFRLVVIELHSAGYHVIVAGRTVSKTLRKVASETIAFDDLVSLTLPKEHIDSLDPTGQPKPFNTIQLPHIDLPPEAPDQK